jgi:hypothetical protein
MGGFLCSTELRRAWQIRRRLFRVPNGSFVIVLLKAPLHGRQQNIEGIFSSAWTKLGLRTRPAFEPWPHSAKFLAVGCCHTGRGSEVIEDLSPGRGIGSAVAALLVGDDRVEDDGAKARANSFWLCLAW